MLRCLFKILLLATSWISISASAQVLKADKLDRTAWAVKRGKRNLFILKLVYRHATLSGSWDRPSEYKSVNGAFTIRRREAHRDRFDNLSFDHGLLHLKLCDLSDPRDLRSYVVKFEGNQAFLIDEGVGSIDEPIRLYRVPFSSMIAIDWQQNRLYTAGDSDISNAEMERIYAEDQQVRQSRGINWGTIKQSDALRRQRTRELLLEGALHTGEDFERAAFVFQHGENAQDYLLAHTLAIISISKGDATAIWIAAATLDRYLQSSGQKQIYGTQFSSTGGAPWTQDPYDREVVTDQIRKELGISPLEVQEQRLKMYSTGN